MFPFLSLFLCCAKQVPVESLAGASKIEPPAAEDSTAFEFVGSPCLDAITAYWMEAGCTGVSREGEDPSSGVFVTCSEAKNQTELSSQVYLILENGTTAASNSPEVVFVEWCSDTWFWVYEVWAASEQEEQE